MRRWGDARDGPRDGACGIQPIPAVNNQTTLEWRWGESLGALQAIVIRDRCIAPKKHVNLRTNNQMGSLRTSSLPSPEPASDTRKTRCAYTVLESFQLTCASSSAKGLPGQPWTCGETTNTQTAVSNARCPRLIGIR